MATNKSGEIPTPHSTDHFLTTPTEFLEFKNACLGIGLVRLGNHFR